MRLGVLVSGGGTNLQAILDAAAAGRINAEVALVIADRESAYGLERARLAGVPTALVKLADHPDRDTFSAAVADLLSASGVELVVLAGYLKILTAPLLRRFAGRIINTHPALLPSFGGPGMHGLKVHQAVLDYGCRLSGCSVHFVDDTVDGGPLLAQVAVPVRDDDTAESLQQRILPHEHQALVRVIGWLADGLVEVQGRRVRVLGEKESAG
ncbi:MAG: phosphoribosylglycinamide formyltransferase [Armatimonadetes bacterium]|nr:phosphoribosylglycinamide formyltransferase [Armatimonadota bacterium]